MSESTIMHITTMTVTEGMIAKTSCSTKPGSQRPPSTCDIPAGSPSDTVSAALYPMSDMPVTCS